MKSYFGILTLVLLVFVVNVENIHAQEESNLLERRIESFSSEGKGLLRILSSLSMEHRLPIGFEISKQEENSSQSVALAFEDKKVSEVIDGILIHFPAYEWKVVDNVINVYPRASRDELLDVKIKTFSFKGKSLYNLRVAIADIPTLKTAAKRKRAEFITLAFSKNDFGGLEKDFSISVESVAFRTLLNSIAGKRKEKPFWVFSRFGNDDEHIVVNF